jgi:cytoskeletal protein CcmA (bactofilin family)
MALWKDSAAVQKEAAPISPAAPAASAAPVTLESTAKADLGFAAELGSVARRTPARDGNESVIGGGVTIVGKIDGAGNVRLGGRFEGDVDIQGDLTIEAGAKLTGSVRALSITIAGEIEGNVESAARVELLPTAIVNGDLKAGTLIVAAGSKMRGRCDFGWDEETPAKAQLTLGSRQAS